MHTVKRNALNTIFCSLFCFISLQVYALSFEPVDSGVTKIIGQWHDSELAKQGGKFSSHGWWPWGAGALDFDNDGDIDIYLSHHGKPGGKLLKNNYIPSGVLGFEEVVIKGFRLPGADDKPWFFDMDGDGWLDLAALSDETKALSLSNRQGTFVIPNSKITFSPLSHPKLVSDINGDGYLDLDGGRKGAFIYQPQHKDFKRDKHYRSGDRNMLPISYQNTEKERKKLKKSNRFFRSNTYQYFLNQGDINGPMLDPVDLNNDKKSDLILRGHGGYGGDYLGQYFLADEDGGYYLANKQLNIPENATPVFLGDVNGDGKQDLILTGNGIGGIYLNSKTGFIKKSSVLDGILNAKAPYLVRVFAVDFDNDMDVDFVVSNPRKRYGLIVENKGNGGFTVYKKFKAWDSNPIIIADLNNDLLLDIAIGGPSSKEFQVYLNQEKGDNKSLFIYPRYKQPNLYAVDAVVTVLDENGIKLDAQRARWDGLPIAVSLGKISKADVVISYPNGVEQRYPNLSSNQSYSLMLDGQSYIGFVPANLVAD